MALARMTVSALHATPVKGLRVCAHEELRLERGGARGDRRFYLVDERGRMVNGKLLGALNTVRAELSDDDSLLSLHMPGGQVVAAEPRMGATLQTQFFSQPRDARLVAGPFSQALSEHAGIALRLVAPADGAAAVDRGAAGAATLISRASLARLAEVAGLVGVDARRFRMTVEVDGADVHAEDGWIGAHVRVGEAVLAPAGHVGRCAVTTRDPETGAVDLPTLELLRSYRSREPTTEPLALGIWGAVVQEGAVHVGDGVELCAP